MATDNDDRNAIAEAKALWISNPRTESGKAARKQRFRKMQRSGDGHSLRATGRTELCNFRAKPEIWSLLKKAVGRGKISLWLEEAILAKLKSEGVDVDA